MTSYSQAGQDLIVGERLGWPTSGYFVDIGAFDWKRDNNTYLFETMGWTGLCCEPIPEFFRRVQAKRSCMVLPFFVGARDSGVVTMRRDGGSSRLAKPGDNRMVDVRCRSLGSILATIGAPEVMDYFSLDVEGFEAELLMGVNLERWRWRVITMEINKPTFAVAEARLLESGYVAERDIMDRGVVLDRLYVHPDII